MKRVAKLGGRTIRKSSLVFLLIFAPLILLREASATLVFYEPISLEELVKSSAWIVVARKASPQEIAGLAAPKLSQPRFHILEVLYGKPLPAFKQKLLTVDGANDELFHMMAEGIQQTGGLGIPSPILKRYESSLSEDLYEKTDKVILFLNGDPAKDSYRFVVENAYEDVRMKDKVIGITRH